MHAGRHIEQVEQFRTFDRAAQFIDPHRVQQHDRHDGQDRSAQRPQVPAMRDGVGRAEQLSQHEHRQRHGDHDGHRGAQRQRREEFHTGVGEDREVGNRQLGLFHVLSLDGRPSRGQRSESDSGCRAGKPEPPNPRHGPVSPILDNMSLPRKNATRYNQPSLPPPSLRLLPAGATSCRAGLSLARNINTVPGAPVIDRQRPAARKAVPLPRDASRRGVGGGGTCARPPRLSIADHRGILAA